jgi:predicted flap endonuclease-1-like 5' DNA nuclease
MASRSISISTANPQISVETDPCDKPNSVCGEQECLTRPRFFCGQLLTDQDLRALTEWSQNKHKLDRHKHGWGIVNGMQVRCDQTNRSRVVVDTGYAVDPCGNDIVVCEQSAVDFSDACPIEEKSCKEFATPEEEPNPQFMGLDLPAGKITVVDLFVHYHEVKDLPLPALGRGACNEREACEYSRTNEHFRFEWCYADVNNTSFDKMLLEWEQDYFTECRKVVDSFEAAFPRPSPDEDKTYSQQLAEQLNRVKEWLIDWLDAHPLHEFCFVRDAIGQLSVAGSNEVEDIEQDITRLLFWIVQDCRNEYLQQRPMPIVEHAGVPVARVWLHRENVSGASCKVIHVEDFPYPRREWSRNDWPAPMGMVNLGRHVWQRAKQVCGIISDLGLEPVRVELPIPQSIMMLRELLKRDVGMVTFRLFWRMRCHDFESEQAEDFWKPDTIGVAVFVDPGNPLADRVFSFFSVEDRKWEEVRKGFTRGESIKKAEATKTRPTAAKADEAKRVTPAMERVVAEKFVAEASKSAVSEEEATDMLATINGIGEKRAFKLLQNGIQTFEDLAKADVKKLQDMFPRGVKEHEFGEWIKQAKRLSK